MSDKDGHGGGGLQKAVFWVGVVVIGLLALRGLFDSAGVNIRAGSDYAGVTWGGPGCCDYYNGNRRDGVTPADEELLRRLYK